MKKVILIAMLCMLTLLGGCGSKKVVDNTAITIESCMKDLLINPSVKGSNITYYYNTAEELAVYYTDNWNKGVIKCKRYFRDAEHYNIQKSLNPDAKFKDDLLTIEIKEYMQVEDMDAHWDFVENSSVYTLVK